MKRLALVIAVVVTCVFFVGALQTHAAPTLSEGGQAKAVIVIPREPTPGEKYAASELQHYLDLIADAHFEVKEESDRGKVKSPHKVMLLLGEKGRGENLSKLLEKGKINEPPAAKFGDSFSMKVVEDGKYTYLCIVGSGQLGLEYGVYDFLEKAYKVGFFWTGEQIPHQSTLQLPELDYAEAPRFERRTHMASGLDYTCRLWDEEEWHSEIKWTLAKKFNTIVIYKGHEAVFKEEVLPQYGVNIEPTPYEKYQAELAKKLGAYARSLGLMVVTPVLPDSFPLDKKFFEKNPKAKHFKVSWTGQDPLTYLDPRDPLYIEMTKKYLEAYEKRYGTSHIYYIDPYPEVDPGGTPEEKAGIRLGYAISTNQAIQEYNPNATWFMSGWAFLGRGDWYDRGVIRTFIESIPVDLLVVNDIYAEDNALYKEFDYWWGRNWGFGAVHTFGSNHTLHGDVSDLIKRVNDLLDDPRADRCVNFYMSPESYRSNPYYWELFAKLGWVGKEVELKTFTVDYAQRRYGKEAAPLMTEAFEHLTGEDGVYTLKQLLVEFPFQESAGKLWGLRKYKDARFIPSTFEALKLAYQAGALAPNNPCFETDLIDIARRFLGDSIGQEMVNLYMAGFHEVDDEKFKAAQQKIWALFDCYERLLASNSDYTLKQEIEWGEEVFGKKPFFKPFYFDKLLPVEEELRLRYTALTNLDKPLGEYNRKDLYEVFRFYYRPRLGVWIKAVEQACVREERHLTKENRKDLEKAFKAITRVFFVLGYELDTPLPTGDPVKVVGEIIQRFGQNPE